MEEDFFTVNKKEENSKLTPMMKQYIDIKDKYSDSIVLFRMGDFYEAFFEDAEKLAQILILHIGLKLYLFTLIKK